MMPPFDVDDNDDPGEDEEEEDGEGEALGSIDSLRDAARDDRLDWG